MSADYELPAWLQVTSGLTETIGTAITAAALIVAGIWAYFRFVKDRTYRPKLDVTLSGAWLDLDGVHHLHARVVVANIGGTAVELVQVGTGLVVSGLAPAVQGKRRRSWRQVTKQAVFDEHGWIEPQERISDDVLLDLGVDRPVETMLELRLVCVLSKTRWRRPAANVVVFARRILPAVPEPATPGEGAQT